MNTFIYHICFLLQCIFLVDVETVICKASSRRIFELQNFDFDEAQNTINSIDTEEYYDDEGEDE